MRVRVTAEVAIVSNLKGDLIFPPEKIETALSLPDIEVPIDPLDSIIHALADAALRVHCIKAFAERMLEDKSLKRDVESVRWNVEVRHLKVLGPSFSG